MVSVSRHPKPDQLGIDAGAAALRMLELLDVERTGTFAEHKTVASFVERTACAARVVIPRRQRLHRIESADPQLRHSRLRTTTQRRIRHPTLDQHQRVANVVIARCARRDHTVVRSSKSVADRDVPTGNIRDEHRYKERREPSGAVLYVVSGLLMEDLHPADPASEDHGNAVALVG